MLGQKHLVKLHWKAAVNLFRILSQATLRSQLQATEQRLQQESIFEGFGSGRVFVLLCFFSLGVCLFMSCVCVSSLLSLYVCFLVFFHVFVYVVSCFVYCYCFFYIHWFVVLLFHFLCFFLPYFFCCYFSVVSLDCVV